MGSGGLGTSQQAVQKGIAALRPGAVLLGGIAFGADENQQCIGDILVSQQLQLYNVQRVGADRIVLCGDPPHGSARLIDGAPRCPTWRWTDWRSWLPARRFFRADQVAAALVCGERSQPGCYGFL